MEYCSRCKHQDKRGHEEPCAGCIHNAIENFEPMTQADKIRSMTDEELAKFLGETVYEAGENMFYCSDYENTEHCIGHSCKECGGFLEWLKSEVGCE